MLLGFKTGPKTWAEGKKIVEEHGAKFCEIWFDATKIDSYREPLQWFRDHEVKLGLHYWGVIDGRIKPNLATHDDHVRSETIKQIKTTIDYAATLDCAYVNVHPGAAHLEEIDFQKAKQSPVTDVEPTPLEAGRAQGTSAPPRRGSLTGPTPAADAETILLENAQELSTYAKEKNILLTIETLPGREAYNLHTREPLYDPGNTPLTTMQKLAEQGIAIANDITHTASFIAAELTNPNRHRESAPPDGGARRGDPEADEQSPRNKIWSETMKFSRATAPQTRLIHVNTMTPPFNGTDSHDGVTEEDFANNVFPNKAQLQEWLSLYGATGDIPHSQDAKRPAAGDNDHIVFAIPEPRHHMAANYLALAQLSAQLP